MTRFGPVFVVLAGCAAAWSGAAAAGDSVADCAAATTTVDMIACAQADYEAADGDLNETYKLAMDWLGAMSADGGVPDGFPDPRAALREAQLAWIAYRDRNCAWHYALAMGGTVRSLYQIGCLTEMTRARTEELRRMTEPN